MHYYTHHGQMTKGSYLDRLRKYHIDHHFIDPSKGKICEYKLYYITTNSFRLWYIFEIVGLSIQNGPKWKAKDELGCTFHIKFFSS